MNHESWLCFFAQFHCCQLPRLYCWLLWHYMTVEANIPSQDWLAACFLFWLLCSLRWQSISAESLAKSNSCASTLVSKLKNRLRSAFTTVLATSEIQQSPQNERHISESKVSSGVSASSFSQCPLSRTLEICFISQIAQSMFHISSAVNKCFHVVSYRKGASREKGREIERGRKSKAWHSSACTLDAYAMNKKQ